MSAAAEVARDAAVTGDAVALSGFLRETVMMTRQTIVKALLLTAGVASAAMGAFHFFLPTIFQWSRHMAAVPTSIRWALDAINAFFSTLLLLGGIATIRVALLPRRDTMIVWGMTLFWMVNTAYQLLWPFPQRAVSWGTLGFAALMVAAYILALWFGREASAPMASDGRGAAV